MRNEGRQAGPQGVDDARLRKRRGLGRVGGGVVLPGEGVSGEGRGRGMLGSFDAGG